MRTSSRAPRDASPERAEHAGHAGGRSRRSVTRLSRVALGAAVTVVIALAAGCGSPAATPGGGTGSATTPTSGPGASTQPPGTSGGTAPATSPAGTAPSQPAGGPVPPGFAATSVTFVSTQEAFVLGTAPCTHAPCTSILRTLDRGSSWRGLPAPVVPIGQFGANSTNSTSPRVWGIRFASAMQGFVFGYGLWETTDGGEHWVQAATPGGAILSLAITDGQVLALTTSVPPVSGFGNSAATLVRRPLSGGSWQQVTVVHVPWYLDPTDMISTQAGIATVVDGTGVLVTANGGLTFTTHATPCTRPGYASAALATPTPQGGLVLLCTGQGYMGHMDKSVYTSTDLGVKWTQGGTPPSVGAPYSLAAGTPSDVVLSTSSAASWLVRSADGATSWATVSTIDDGGAGWADLGFTTATDGVVVHGPVLSDNNAEGRPGQLFFTDNGGRTWYQVRF